MHTYIHTYVHTCIHIYIHTYVRTYIHPSPIHPSIHPIQSNPIHPSIHPSVCASSMHSLMFTCVHAWSKSEEERQADRQRLRLRFTLIALTIARVASVRYTTLHCTTLHGNTACYITSRCIAFQYSTYLPSGAETYMHMLHIKRRAIPCNGSCNNRQCSQYFLPHLKSRSPNPTP